MNIQNLVLGVGLLVFAASMASSEITCNRFKIKAAREGSQLLVSLDTDLPDATQVMVSIARSYWADTPEQEYPIEYFEKKSTVREWRKGKPVAIDATKWSQEFQEHLRGSAVKVFSASGGKLGVGWVAFFGPSRSPSRSMPITVSDQADHHLGACRSPFRPCRSA